MYNKSFGIRELNLIGAGVTPTLESPGVLNINATNVAISTDITVGNNLSVSGISTLQNDLNLLDDVRINFGTSIDASLEYDTTSSALRLFANNTDLNLFADNFNFYTSVSNTSLKIIDSAAVELYYNNSKKFETTTSGTQVTGDSISTSFKTTSTVGDGSDVGFAIKYYITANGTSAYRFAGPGLLNSTDNPTLYLHRGFSYIFENSTGGTHPFRIQFPGTTLGVGTYLSGEQTGTQILTIPFDAPSTYEYQCTIHSGMVGTFNLVS